MGADRKQYSREFKLQAVQRVLEGDRPAAEIARELGIKPNRLYQWKAEYLAQAEPDTLPREAPDQEIKRLRRELERVRQERDFLKKAVGFFAQNPE